MAEIQDVLRLSIDEALRDIGRVESALDRALAPVEVDIQVDERALAELENTLHEVQRIADRAATETQSIALAAGRAEVNFEDLARAMGITEAEARDLTAELLDAQAASNRLEDSARDVARQLGLSESEANRLTTSLRQADRAAEAIDVSAAAIATRFGGIRTAAAGVAGAFAAIGGVALLGGAIRGANAAIQSFAQLEDSINAVNVVFGTASTEVLEFGETAAASAGLSASAFNQAVVPIGSLLRNFGFDAREAADAAVVLVQRAADLASVFGGTVNDALAAVGAGLRGEINPLERYGAGLSAVRVEQFALASGLAATKAEITPAITLQARYGLILSDTARVAGDFADTSDDLANAQRSAVAETQNLIAELGTALAPAFEAILSQAPAVLAFFDSLIPQLTATADSAAAAGAGLAGFVSAVTLGFGQLGDVAGGAGDILSALPALIEDVAGAAVDWDFSFRGVRAQMDQFNQRTANAFIRTASQSIPAAIARGDAATTAFGNAIAFLARQDDSLNTIQDAFDRLTRVAGLTDTEAQAVTQTLIDQRVELGLNADEVAFLTDQWEIFRNNLIPAGNEVAHAARAMGEFDAPFRTFTTRFTTFTSDLEEIPAQMDSVAVRTRQAADLLGQALNPFDEAPEDIGVSAREFFQNITDEINREAEFQAGIVELIIRGHFDLARMLGDQGPAVQEALTGFLGDDLLATATEAALQTGSTATSDAIGDALLQAIQDVPAGPAREALIALITDGVIDSPQVERGIVDGFASQAGKGVSSFRDALIAEGAAMQTAQIEAALGERIETSFTAEDAAEFAAGETVNAYEVSVIDRLGSSSFLAGADVAENVADIFGSEGVLSAASLAGLAARSAFYNSLATAGANEERRIRDSIESTLNNAIQKRSPPKLFLDAGLESGEAFWSGFNQSNLTLKTALPGITGKIAEGSMPVAGAGSTEINFNLPNLETRDADVTIARATQLAGSVAGILNGNFKL